MICRKCNQDLPESNFSPGLLKRCPSHHLCRKCNCERVKEYMDKHPEKRQQYDAKYLAKNKDKQQAKLVILDAIRYRGFDVKPCQVCGAINNVAGHHPSYLPEDWLTVVWLCPICHKGAHSRRIDISGLERHTAPPIQGRWGERAVG